MEPLTDAQIEERLRAVPEDRWEALWAKAAALEAEDEHGWWKGGQQVGTTTVDGVEKPLIHMPYVELSDTVDLLWGAVYGLGASEPFDWHAWGGLDRYRGGEGLAAAPVAEAVRLMIAVSRADRFYEGTLLAAANDGTLLAIVARLRRWYDGERSAPVDADEQVPAQPEPASHDHGSNGPSAEGDVERLAEGGATT